MAPQVTERSLTASMPNPRRGPLPALLALAFLAFALPASAVRLTGVSFASGLVYDVDATTGAAINPRSLSIVAGCTEGPGLCAFVLDDFAGVEIAPDGTMLLIPVESAEFFGSSLIGAHVDASFALWADPLGVQIGEGDLALDPLSGDLYAVGLTNLIAPFTLVRIEQGPSGWEDATASVVGEIGVSDVSGLAFDATGALYALDTAADALLVLDPTDASTLSSVALSAPLGALAGMDFDLATGALYVADGGSGGTDMLSTLDPGTGVLTAIGPLGVAGGLSGLAVPEPDVALLAIVAGAALAAVVAIRRR
jgi:DNA-binding beta-propeller fold protein YncE